MGAIFSSPSTPAVPPVPASPPPLQSPYGGAVQQAGQTQAQRTQQASGFGSTLITGAAGLPPAQTTQKTLLGQ